MSKRQLLLGVIDAISEVLAAKKDCEITLQDLRHANALFVEIANDHEDLVALLEIAGQAIEGKAEAMRQEILSCIARMWREQRLFTNECERIVLSRKRER